MHPPRISHYHNIIIINCYAYNRRAGIEDKTLFPGSLILPPPESSEEAVT